MGLISFLDWILRSRLIYVKLVAALESLGYTEREAAFLYLVAAHSGYFLRRQFNYFVDRYKGFIAHRFIEKAHAAGHVETIDYGQGFYIYHLFSKPIYRLLGNADSQNRRRKGDAMIRARLMALEQHCASSANTLMPCVWPRAGP